jgi:hypothetical protein
MDWLIRFEASELDHLGPLFGFFSDELAEVASPARSAGAASVPRYGLSAMTAQRRNFS